MLLDAQKVWMRSDFSLKNAFGVLCTYEGASTAPSSYQILHRGIMNLENPDPENILQVRFLSTFWGKNYWNLAQHCNLGFDLMFNVAFGKVVAPFSAKVFVFRSCLVAVFKQR